MPVMHGKSKGAFEHNIKAEMKAGKPQPQALAIAYSIKRKAAQKKMAKGGMVNEDLDPAYEPAHGAEDMVRKELDFGREAQDHDVLPEPKEPMEHAMPDEEDMPAHMMAKGGMVSQLMKKRMMADGGFPVKKDMNYAEGGYVDDMGMNDQEVDPDTFLSEHMEPSHYDHVGHEDESDLMADELHEPKKERRKVLMGIMAGLHREHLGK